MRAGGEADEMFNFRSKIILKNYLIHPLQFNYLVFISIDLKYQI